MIQQTVRRASASREVSHQCFLQLTGGAGLLPSKINSLPRKTFFHDKDSVWLLIKKKNLFQGIKSILLGKNLCTCTYLGSPRVPILPSLISPPPTATRPIDYDRFNRGAQVTRVISSHRMDGLESRVRIIEQTQKELVEELTNVQKLAVHPMQSASPNTGQLVDFAGDRWTQVVYELRQRLDGLQSRLDKMPDVLFHRAGHGSSTGHAAGFLQQVQELTEHYEHLKQQFQQLRQDWARQKESITANLSFSIAESQGKANTAAINEAHKKIAKLTKDQNELVRHNLVF